MVTGYSECIDSFFAFGLFETAKRSGFFPPELVDTFEPVIQEEARHILFFVNWVGLAPAQHAAVAPAFLRAQGAGGVAVSRLGAHRHRARRGNGVQDNNFTVTGAKTLGNDIDVAELIDLCLAENDAAHEPLRSAPAAAVRGPRAGEAGAPALCDRGRRMPGQSPPDLVGCVKIRIAIIAALGLALALYLVKYVGLGAVLAAAVAVGWGGFALLCLYALALFALLGAAWYVLQPDSSRPDSSRPDSSRIAPWVFIWGRMVRDAAAEVLPFSQIGGMVFGARVAILHGVSPPLSFASMVVDVTTEMLAQIAYIALGVAILGAYAPRTSFSASLTTVVVIGLMVAALAGGLFLALQRFGHRLTEKLAARLLPRAVGTTASVGAALDAVYGSPVRVGLSAALHLAAWIASAFGTWIAFRLIGVRVGWASVMAIESLVYATRSAAAFVPNALGVQEAAYAVLAPLFGIGAEFGLAVSLLKRARDIALGVPILLIWQFVEGHRAIARSAGIRP